jgi:hypothetical protein
MVIFDTRPEAEPDGSWNNWIKESSIEVAFLVRNVSETTSRF